MFLETLFFNNELVRKQKFLGFHENYWIFSVSEYLKKRADVLCFQLPAFMACDILLNQCLLQNLALLRVYIVVCKKSSRLENEMLFYVEL